MRAPFLLVAGGGPAGAAVASELARGGFRVLLCVGQANGLRAIGECIQPSVRASLRRLAILNALENDKRLALSLRGIRQCWGSPRPVERDFVFGSAGDGWSTDRALFDRHLRERATTHGVEVRTGWTVCALEPQRDGCIVATCTNGDVCENRRADFVVDATGRGARVARLMGAHPEQRDATVALHTTVPGPLKSDARLWLEATPRGWWYSTPLPEGRLVAGFVTDSDLLAPRTPVHSQAKAFLAEAPETRARLGASLAESKWRARPAGTSRLIPPIGDRWLALGDAAAGFDPLSSYGLSFALGSAIYAAQALAGYFNGEGIAALHAYAYTITRACSAYARGLAEAYQLETRWPDERFWMRRRRPVSSSPQDDNAKIHSHPAGAGVFV